MKKIKGLLVAFVALFVCTFAMVTVNATDVASTTNTNDTSANYDVKIYDGTKKIFGSMMTEGSTITYKPIKWGYDFVGFYTDADLTQSFAADTPISGATTLYVKWNEWPAGTIANPRIFDLSLMAKGYEVFGDENPGQATQLGENYGLLAGNTVFQEESSPREINGLGTATHFIKTGGAITTTKNDSTNGLTLSVPGSGQLVVYAKSDSSEPRSIAAIPRAGYVTHTEAANTVIHSEEIDDQAIVKVTLDIPYKGTYKIGSTSGSMLIYYAEFVEHSVTLYSERVSVDDVEHIRLVAKLVNMDNLDDLSFVLKSDAFENDLDLTEVAKIGTRITDHGETYSFTVGTGNSSTTYTFDIEDGVVYVKCVVEVGSKYIDAIFTAEITVGGRTSTVTIRSLA